MARTPILAGNWKMHGTTAEAAALAGGLARAVGARSDRQVVLAPPFTALATVRDAIRGTRIALSAQNMHWEAKGAFTGEVSPAMVRDAGATHVILGHSERRCLFGETDEMIRRKIESALANELTAIVCVGETLEQRDDGRTLAVVSSQVDAALRGVSAAQARRIVVAYEPVWAIGTGRVATREQAQEVHGQLRALLRELALPADEIPILYGGSVKPDNIDGLMAEPDIDGALVGGASLDVAGFTRIVEYQS
ncbi:MAG TPA: triose-phosphate isomerase [Candidatus Binatia bacterium]|nr:triose-phosphate isomerase [Candidatus Binatia bacterium]